MDGDLSWPLRRAAELYGTKEAVNDGDRSVTYAALAHDIQGLSGGLTRLGIEPGARVGYLGGNSVAHVECCMGIPASGRVIVDLNFRLAEPELAFMVDDCGVEAIVVDDHQLEVARALRERCAGLHTLIYDGPGSCPDDCLDYWQLAHGDGENLPRLDIGALAAISYTGGTTGKPKGVMLSHGNLLANARHNLITTGHSASDRWLHVCPMFHVAGTANVFACTWVGAQQFVLPRFDARAVIASVRERAITHTVLVPTMLGMLLDELELEREPDGDHLSSLRHIQYAASPISAALQRRALAYFDCDIAQFYGMTEAAPTVTQLSPEEHRHGADDAHPDAERLRGIGRPVVGVEVAVRDEHGSVCAAGEVGELWVRGANVMLGYWNREEATAEALVDGWYRSGDAARRDADGYLYLVDRLKDMIISGGENVYSVEVESALCEHEAVAEAAVVGIPHPRWGEAVHAVVALVPGKSVGAEDLIAHCRGLIAGYKVPRSVEFSDGPLPKSGAGKLLKNVLREPYWTEHERRVS